MWEVGLMKNLDQRKTRMHVTNSGWVCGVRCVSRITGSLFLLPLLLSACSANTDRAGRESAGRGDLRFVVVTHGQAADPNWSVVQNGVRQAARDMGVSAEYQAPESFDMVAMGQLIDAAVASRPSGLVVSIPDPSALRAPIQKAIRAGIPVVSINSGGDVAAELGAIMHVGQTEYEAGHAAGERMAQEGVRNAFCVNHEVGNGALDQRCDGMRDAMQQTGATSQVLAVELADPTETQQRIQAAMAANPTIDGMLALGPVTAASAMQAVGATGRSGSVRLATFDTSPEVLRAIAEGELLFAVDQQMYLQGYLPIVLLTLHTSNLNTLANDVIRTGPSFITSENAERLIELSARGTR